MTEASKGNDKEISFLQASLPVLFLIILILYGLVLRPHILEQSTMPLELIFILASCFAAGQLYFLGYTWNDIVEAFMVKLSKALPTILILFAIGLVIGSWIISGTIPMFVYYGIKLINPLFIYVLAFLLPVIFSTFTGTSWGSVGTVGIVIIGIAGAIEAHLPICAGAIVGGAYFGDKMSPLSDTTNMAALAVDVDLYDHIHSMLYTTLPSAIISASIYMYMGFHYPPAVTDFESPAVLLTLSSIQEIFNFNILLILPVLVVLIGSYKKMPTIPVLVTSSLTAWLIAILFQNYGLGDIFTSAHHGFNTEMALWAPNLPDNIPVLFNRGGLYALSEPAIIALFVFVYIGIIGKINAMPIIVNRVFGFAKSRSAIILSSLFSSAFTNALTSNQYATSFIVGEAFKSKYDKNNIHRKVLSRSIEDYGTMIESIVPWTPTAIFMVASLGVPFGEYWYWQLLTLINLVVAALLAITGIACFKNDKE